MKSKYTKTDITLFILVAIFLFIGILNFPYGYYTFLRIFVTISSIYLFLMKKSQLSVVGLLIAILFNPVFPIYLSKDIWIVIDLISGIFFVSQWYNNKEKL